MIQHRSSAHMGIRKARALTLATASAMALLCSAPVQAQDAAQSAQTAAGPTGAAQDQQGASPAAAPTPQSSADATTPANSGEVVVTGTRAPRRSRLDTASPVDVLSANSLHHQGTTELGTAIATVAPSVNFPRPAATDATDAIRPATLRGLSPDQTLVLINNIRAHPAATLNTNGTVGRGSAAVDLNSIPTAALDRVEVLRDGASAQYGSDAIAGVINLRLRQARSGGSLTVTHGFYDTTSETARDVQKITGEPTTTVDGWTGLGFGKDGYLTLSGQYVSRAATNRSDAPDPSAVTPVDGPTLRARFGDPRVRQYSGFANAGIGIAPDWQLYGWAGYQRRHTSSAAFPRPTSPGTRDFAALAGYPKGFIPFIDTVSKDLNSAVGVKGEVGNGWNVDLSASYGRNKVSFRTLNSANYAFGAASPHNFYDGAVTYDQLVGNLDVTKTLPVFQSLNLAMGLEGRREGYQITPGEQASYGPPVTGAVAGAAAGAQGFGGFSPLNAIKRHRENASAYVDAEAQVTDKLLIAAAVRGESYSDFGEVATGKLSARYDFSHAFALRGTVSTGFRAPSLQQQYFTSIASVITNGAPILTGTFPSTDPVAKALGGLPLRPEKSTNYSLGTVVRLGGFDLTVDGYYIRLHDQLGLSESISAPGVLPPNVSAARFFINGLASHTEGVDVVGHYRLPTATAGVFDFTLAGNVNKTKVTRVPTSTSTLNPAPTLFARSRILTLEEGTPGEKVSGTVDWSLKEFGATARVTYYGDVNEPGTVETSDIHTGRHAITDLEVRYAPRKGLQLALGAQNLFDVYPDRAPATINGPSGLLGYPYYSPFGFNGRYLYGRAGINF